MFLKRSVALLLLTIFLLADCGQVISMHTCLRSNHASYSILPAEKECCKADADDHCVVKRTCCSVTSKYIKQSIAIQTQVQNIPVDEQANAFIATDVFVLPDLPAFAFQPYPDFDIRVPRQQDCSFIQVFRC